MPNFASILTSPAKGSDNNKSIDLLLVRRRESASVSLATHSAVQGQPTSDSGWCPKRWSPVALLASVVLLTAVVLPGCGPGYLDAGQHIPATAENKQVFDVVRAYQEAVENRDIEALRKLVSQRYHENGGTTDNVSDDYGYDKLMQRLEMLTKNVKRVDLKIRLVEMNVTDLEAVVDCEFRGRTLLSEGSVDAYRSWDNFARMRLAKEGGKWLFVGGL